MIRPCSIAATMLAKLSSVSTMSAVCLVTSVPVMPMATPMLARLSAGASFTPSPVIATTWSRAFIASTMRVLCCGETRQHTCSLSVLAASSSSVSFSISGPGEHQAAWRQQADLARDRLGGVLVIAGHHDALQPGASCHLHRLDDLRARRVDHAEQADEGEILLDVSGRGLSGLALAGDRRRPARSARCSPYRGFARALPSRCSCVSRNGCPACCL